MAKQRNYSTEFKRQVVLEYLAGETLYGLSKRHDVSRNVIRLWIARYETDGGLDDDTTAADLCRITRRASQPLSVWRASWPWRWSF